MFFEDQVERENPKLRKNTRNIFFKKMDGKFSLAASGLIDKGLFEGENRNYIIAEMDTRTLLWSLRYAKGTLPEPLKQKFVTFKQVEKFLTHYFKRRNIEIERIED